MTVLTTASDRGVPLRAPGTGATFRTTAAQTAKRSMLQYVRTPQLLVMPPITGAFFLLIFRYIFGGAIRTGGSVRYVDFLVPGFLAQAVLWGAMNIPAGVAEDAAAGVYDRLRSLPIPRAAVVAGRALADTALNAVGLVVTLLLGLAIGFRPHGDAVSLLVAAALLLVVIHAFSWLFISIGLTFGNAQAAQASTSLILVPLTFVSAAYVPIRTMPGWMQTFAAHQPVTVVINAVRSLLLGGTDIAGAGHTTTYWVALTLAWCAGILAVFATVAVIRFGRVR